MDKKVMLFLAVFILALPPAGFAADKVLYSFENKNETCWEVPEWCFEKEDYVCKTVEISDEVAKDGKSSLKLTVDFPGQIWRGAIAECESYVDLAPYNKISCDFYLPKGAPHGIQAKLILTVKPNSEWKWIETIKAIDLIPGQWVTMTASLKPDSKDWMLPLGSESGRGANDPNVAGAVIVEMTDSVKANVEKIAVRVETDKTGYDGEVFIDNITVSD